MFNILYQHALNNRDTFICDETMFQLNIMEHNKDKDGK